VEKKGIPFIFLLRALPPLKGIFDTHQALSLGYSAGQSFFPASHL